MSAVSPQDALVNNDVPSRSCTTPLKRVKTVEHMPMWRKSELFAVTVSFIGRLNSAIRGVPGLGATFQGKGSEAAQAIAEFLDMARGWVADIPAAQQAQRFGNKSFRQWHDRANEASAGLHKKILSLEAFEAGAAEELTAYLLNAFGNRQRIDYGTGHELCFVIWLAALAKLRTFTREDAAYLVAVVFHGYLRLMRELQTVYWLEPAGSKGVWGLDDYQFLPFLWGSSQLCDNPDKLECSAILSFTQEQADRYMYLDGVRFVQAMKTGLFQEHSAMLFQTSLLASWEKVNSGMRKHYDEEVLNKFPVVQHILFGSILSFGPLPQSQSQSQQQQQQRGATPSSASAAEQGVMPSRFSSAVGGPGFAAEIVRRPHINGPGIQITSTQSRLPLRGSSVPGVVHGLGAMPRRDLGVASVSPGAHIAGGGGNGSGPEAGPQKQRARRQSFPETFE